MNTDTVSLEIAAFLTSAYGCEALESHTNLFDAGIVNSLMLMDLMTYVSNNYHLDLQADDLKPQNLSTVSDIAAMVIRRSLLHQPM